MARITTCSSCFNPVFVKAERCPHCGVGRLARNRPRLLTRRNWVFILVALAIFCAADTAHLLKRRNQRERVLMEHQVREQVARGFLTCFFSPNAASDVEPFVHPGVEPADLVARARASLPGRMGADCVVDRLRLRRWGTSHVRVRGFAWPRTVMTDKLVYDAVVNGSGRFWKVRGLLQVASEGGQPSICDFRVEGCEDLGTTLGSRSATASTSATTGGRDG